MSSAWPLEVVMGRHRPDLSVCCRFVDPLKRIIPGRFSWSGRRPAEVSLILQAPSGPVPWVLSRDLLLWGTISQVGEGDVVFTPDFYSGMLGVVLSSPTGRVSLRCSLRLVANFVEESLDRCSLDDETAVVEAALSSYLVTQGWAPPEEAGHVG